MAATPASMLRIVAYGLQDRERLNAPRGQPSVRFYTGALRRRTRWASQWRRVDFDNGANFGRTATVTLPILGELITRATLIVELPNIKTPQDVAAAAGAVGPHWSWTNSIGHAIASDMTFLMGGQVMDSLDSRLLEVLDEQTGTIEHFDSTNLMIGRNPTNYNELDYRVQQQPHTLEIIPPFWWNRGPGPQALPIQALSKEKVQISVTFRPVQQCVYTDARLPPPAIGIPPVVGAPFVDASGMPIPGVTMPTAESGFWRFTDAYWIVEYVSLEDREAAAFRMADLTIPIEQHVAIPAVPTEGAHKVRIPLNQAGLVRDMTWVAQRTEATAFNAYFLFSKDLGPVGLSPVGLSPVGLGSAGGEGPWWPDAQIPNWDYGDGFIRPGFSDRRSDPIVASAMTIRGKTRFELEGPSFCRSLMPALNCRRTPLINRYIHRYDFGFWPTGGLAEALERPVDEVRGAANWDRLPSKELLLTMGGADDCGSASSWVTDDALPPVTYFYAPGQVLRQIPTSGVAAYRVELRGATGFNAPTGGNGAIVRGVVDVAAILRQYGPTTKIWVRMTAAGSAALVIQKPSGAYEWIAVAGAGGSGKGGNAASAVAIGFRGDGAQTHASSGTWGGAGGGRLSEAGVGAPDGNTMPLFASFVTGDNTTGGTTLFYAGGDGYTGGGSGILGGGGGGSYVSTWISSVESLPGVDGPTDPESRVTLTPLRRVVAPPPTFDIYIWLTTYNMLRITGGRGALMFTV